MCAQYSPDELKACESLRNKTHLRLATLFPGMRCYVAVDVFSPITNFAQRHVGAVVRVPEPNVKAVRAVLPCDGVFVVPIDEVRERRGEYDGDVVNTG